MQKEGFFKKAKLRKVKYLNNILEQDHRPIKRQYHFSLGYHGLETARNTIDRIESIYMIFKGQIRTLLDVNAYDVKIFIEGVFSGPDFKEVSTWNREPFFLFVE